MPEWQNGQLLASYTQACNSSRSPEPTTEYWAAMTNPRNFLKDVMISPAASIGEAMAHLDRAGTGALAICSEDRRLLGFLTDGDVRRAILNSCSLVEPCGSICSLKPVTAIAPVHPAEALHLMDIHDVNHLPVVDEKGVLCDFLLRSDFGSPLEAEASTENNLENAVITPSSSIGRAIAALDEAGTGALVLCNCDRVLKGVLTDGDVRRAILHGTSTDLPCEMIATRTPVIATHPISSEYALELMDAHDVNHLPVVDSQNRIMQLIVRKDLTSSPCSDMSAVIMAGGHGRRLLPLTKSTPKPMLPVGGSPLLELTIRQLRRCGIRDVSITTHYLSDAVVDYFGDGERFGVKLNYINEDRPMGTVGGLKRLKKPDQTFLVINGDIITNTSFDEMLAFHRKYRAVMTVGVRKYDIDVPFGVVDCEDVHIKKLQEKPSLSFFINAGTYLLEPSIFDHIPDTHPFDMTDLIQALLKAHLPVVSFPIIEYWLDVGRHEDYERAQREVPNLKAQI